MDSVGTIGYAVELFKSSDSIEEFNAEYHETTLSVILVNIPREIKYTRVSKSQVESQSPDRKRVEFYKDALFHVNRILNIHHWYFDCLD